MSSTRAPSRPTRSTTAARSTALRSPIPRGEGERRRAGRARRHTRRRTWPAGRRRRRRPAARLRRRRRPVEHLAEVVGAGQSLEAALVVDGPVVVLDGHALAGHVVGERGVEVAGAGAHDEPLQRGQPHRRVDGPAALHGGGAGAVAQVQDDAVRCPRAARGRACARPGARRTRATCRGSRSGARPARRARPAARHTCRRAAAGVWWNAVSKTATCGCRGKACWAAREAGEVGRVVQRGERDEPLDVADDLLVDAASGR